ncbi:MAG: hypothetical protein U1E82_07140 [Nitrosomonas sp.]|nr:hypothetical protein [Nitrosomonas sp.]
MKKTIVVILILVLSSSSVFSQTAKIQSVYTNLSGDNCYMVSNDLETGSTIQQCPGINGYSLFVLDDDNRVSITLISPDHKEYPLNFWTVITKSFSVIGENAEWRVLKTYENSSPIALIIRVDADIQEDLESPRKESYLAIARISADKVCVIAKILYSEKAKEIARLIADNLVFNDCLGEF